MITLDNVSYRYPRGAEALENVSARIGAGIHLLLGENGAGKTTLLHIISGLLAPCSGECRLDDTATCRRLPSTQRSIFLLGDEMRFPARTINEFSRAHSVFYPTFSRPLLDEALAAFGMTGDEKLDHMSFGTRKKAQLAYVLALKVPVLLLDEPANGLDIDSRKTLRRLMSVSVDETQTVIVSTHSVADLGPLFEALIVLHGSHLLLVVSAQRILSRLAFTVGSDRPAGAIYAEPELGTWRAIIPNPEGEPLTDIDYTLLYSALMTGAGAQILQILE